jgi:imidazolonepropionase-like amidohydrolase
VASLGTDLGDPPFRLRAEQEAGRLGGALYLSAGRGIAAPNAGPGNPALKASAYGVTTEDEARKAVRDEVAKKVAFVKVWVDDRNGTVEKLNPALYRAVIDEAHKLNARVVAHVFYLADAKALARAGVNGFAHLPRDREADDELVALMKQHDVFMIPNLSISENGVHSKPPAWLDDPFLLGFASTAEIDRLRGTYARRSPEAVERARSTFAGMQRSLMRLHRGGVTIAFGTDAGAVQDHFHAYTDHHELQLMVQAGMSRADVLTAATKTSADVLHLPQHGIFEAGKRANFVVLDANPLDEIANTEKIVQVFMSGRAVDRSR